MGARVRISAPPPGERVRIEIETDHGLRLAECWLPADHLARVLADDSLMVVEDAQLWPLPSHGSCNICGPAIWGQGAG